MTAARKSRKSNGQFKKGHGKIRKHKKSSTRKRKSSAHSKSSKRPTIYVPKGVRVVHR